MKRKQENKLLKLWKARQEAEGRDVSGVTTLEEAKHYYDKSKTATKPNAKPKTAKRQG